MRISIQMIGLVVAFLMFSCLFGADAHGAWEKILVVRVSGTVLVSKSGNGQWEASHKWMELQKGARVKTLSGASVDLLLDNGAVIRMKENSEMLVRNMLDRLKKALSKAKPGACQENSCRSGIEIQLIRGQALFYVSPDFSGLPLLVDTPIGTAGVTGTRFAVDLSIPGVLHIAVLKGHVIAWQKGLPGKPVMVGPNSIVRIEPKRPLLPPRPMDRNERKRYEECLKLHLGLGLHESLSETSSRYRGVFSRGYSPDVLTDIEPPRTYRHSNVNENKQATNQKGTHHKEHKGSSSKTKAGGIDTHVRKSHNEVSDHHAISDHHHMSDHQISDHHTDTHYMGMDQHHTPDRGMVHEAPSSHRTSHGSQTGPSLSEPRHVSSPTRHESGRQTSSSTGHHK